LFIITLIAPTAWAQYEEIVARSKPAVVLIVNEMTQGSTGGTGFFIDANGYIATNRHVIEDANRITVLTPDGKRLPAWVVRYSTVFDAAIIKVIGVGFPTLPLGDSDTVRQGQEVLVVGYGGGFVPGMQSVAEVTVTRGIVSALRPAAGLIQIDAAINPGNSGGPVLNRSGEVIGVAVSRLEKLGDRPAQQINYAVAVGLLRTLAIELSPGEIPVPRSAQPTAPPVAPSAPVTPVLAVPGRSIGQWTLEHTPADIAQAYGPPPRVVAAQMPGYVNYCWDQPPVCVVGLVGSSRLVSINASGGPGSVRLFVDILQSGGLRIQVGPWQIGDPESSIVRVLGTDLVWQRPDIRTHWLIYDGLGVSFVINDSTGIVVAVSVFRPGTARSFIPVP
jgi:hypothetical protein